MNFQEYLTRARQEARLTQGEVARRCKLSDAYINQLETGRADPPTRRVCTILARALGVDGKELWGHAFSARLERWLKREGFRKIPKGLAYALYDDLTTGS